MPTPTERLWLLNQYRVLEIIDPTNRAAHDRDAQAIELTDTAALAALFAEMIGVDTPLISVV